ncbi:hypothetical protein Tco_1166736 [Tanacetum coccineum]
MLMITLIGSSASLGYSIFPEFLKTQSCSEFFPLLLPELQKDGWIDSPQELSKTWDHPHQALISKYCPPSMTVKQFEDIYHFNRKMGSSNSIDGLAALVNKLDNLGRHMKKLKESVHAIQKEFGQTTPFNGSNGGKFHVGPPGYYTKTDNRPSYGEKRQSLEELLAKHQEESARKTKEAISSDKDPLERCFDEYKWVFHREIEQLADEYQIKIGEKGQILNEIWAKYKRVQGKNKDWWYDYWYEDEEKMELGIEDYNPPIVHTETFEVTKYKFNNGCSFINVSSKNNETLSLGRKNGSRFRKMIMEEALGSDEEDSDEET